MSGLRPEAHYSHCRVCGFLIASFYAGCWDHYSSDDGPEGEELDEHYQAVGP